MISDCLIELGTEELPPKTLQSLSAGFAELMHQALDEADLKPAAVKVFATPRRLAMLFGEIPIRQPNQLVQKRGPALCAAFDVAGKPSKAALGFAKACGVAVDDLISKKTDKGSWLYFEKIEPGLSLKQLLPDLLNQVLARLPIAKPMRWGEHRAEFVRPVKWLLVLVGDEPVKASAFGVESGPVSYGHRFHAPGEIQLNSVSEYEQVLLSRGMVIANFERRRDTIRKLVENSAGQLGGVAHIEGSLLEEVTALVEYPVAVCGEFDPVFLQMPPEVLVMTMQNHQKCFAIFDENNHLLPHFIGIANIDSRQPELVAHGYERVIRPRFNDARFFLQQDQKQPLSALMARLDTVVFQEQLGSIGDKVKRIGSLAVFIAAKIGADQTLVKRAAELCKCDLITDMVGEFPALQGIMGRYYAAHDNENPAVSMALEQYYRPRYAGDILPQSDIAQCLALADRLDSLVGIFAVGQKPSGDKDPFALRRAALSVVRILVECKLSLDFSELCRYGVENLPNRIGSAQTVDEVINYIFDRLGAYYQEQQIGFDIVDAVIATSPTGLYDCDLRIQAVSRFQQHEAAAALAAANKRINNILKKQVGLGLPAVNRELLETMAEKQLFEQLQTVQAQAQHFFFTGQYLQGLEQLARLRTAVDQFFDEVMVMTDVEAVRHNRLALLQQLRLCFRQVADFSRIQAWSNKTIV